MPAPWAPIADMEQFARWHREQMAFVLQPLQESAAEAEAPHPWQLKLSQWHVDAPVKELKVIRNAVASSDFRERAAVCEIIGRAIDAEAELDARQRAQKAWSTATTSMSAVLKFSSALKQSMGTPAHLDSNGGEEGSGRVLSPKERRQMRMRMASSR